MLENVTKIANIYGAFREVNPLLKLGHFGTFSGKKNLKIVFRPEGLLARARQFQPLKYDITENPP